MYLHFQRKESFTNCLVFEKVLKFFVNRKSSLVKVFGIENFLAFPRSKKNGCSVRVRV